MVIEDAATEDFVSCDDGQNNLKQTSTALKKMQLDMKAINMDVDGPQGPLSVKASHQGSLKDHKALRLTIDTSEAASRKALLTPHAVHLETLAESDYED